MKTVIVYKTKYGTSKKYADWLSSELDYDVFEMDGVDVNNLKDYDRVIVISGTYASQMPLTSFLKDNWSDLKSKNIVIIAVGAAPEGSLWSKFSYFLIPGRIKKNSEYFKLPGPYKNMGEEPRKEYLNRVIKFLKK